MLIHVYCSFWPQFVLLLNKYPAKCLSVSQFFMTVLCVTTVTVIADAVVLFGICQKRSPCRNVQKGGCGSEYSRLKLETSLEKEKRQCLIRRVWFSDCIM